MDSTSKRPRPRWPSASIFSVAHYRCNSYLLLHSRLTFGGLSLRGELTSMWLAMSACIQTYSPATAMMMAETTFMTHQATPVGILPP